MGRAFGESPIPNGLCTRTWVTGLYAEDFPQTMAIVKTPDSPHDDRESKSLLNNPSREGKTDERTTKRLAHPDRPAAV